MRRVVVLIGAALALLLPVATASAVDLPASGQFVWDGNSRVVGFGRPAPS